MNVIEFFQNPQTVAQKQYEALRMYFIEEASAKVVAAKYGYTYRAFTSLILYFTRKLEEDPTGLFIFNENKQGRKITSEIDSVSSKIIELRKNYYSVSDIKVTLDALGLLISERNIYNVLQREGFARLPRRSKLVKNQLTKTTLTASKSCQLSFEPEDFKSSNAGILAFLPVLKQYKLDKIILSSDYPGTSVINKLSSILSFVALKLSNRRRYSSDDTWCMDRGLGLFAGLNVLPKTAWFTSYSDRITNEMNLSFLKQMHQVWVNHGLLADTANLDFTTIPYWGDDSHLENNWSGKRGKALGSMLAVLAHDPDSGIIDYGDTNVLQKNESEVVLEFLDFYYSDLKKKNCKLRYMVFDSKFTNYENLRKIDEAEIRFITIRRRGKQILDRIDKLPTDAWQKIKVDCAGNKQRTLSVCDEQVFLKEYNNIIRQITITGHGKIKPAIIITNDFDLPVSEIVRKYSRRWSVEKVISEQIQFFHLNMVSSSMVIKVDFDLTMSILAYNLYRLFALNLERYSNLAVQSLYDKFIYNDADVSINSKSIIVKLKKKRNLPLILETMQNYSSTKYPWLKNKKVIFEGASYS